MCVGQAAMICSRAISMWASVTGSGTGTRAGPEVTCAARALTSQGWPWVQ